MSKQKLYCRLVYEKNEVERYTLEISTDNCVSWGVCVSCVFVHALEYPQDENNYIHYAIVKELAKCIELGYNYIGLINR